MILATTHKPYATDRENCIKANGENGYVGTFSPKKVWDGNTLSNSGRFEPQGLECSALASINGNTGATINFIEVYPDIRECCKNAGRTKTRRDHLIGYQIWATSSSTSLEHILNNEKKWVDQSHTWVLLHQITEDEVMDSIAGCEGELCWLRVPSSDTTTVFHFTKVFHDSKKSIAEVRLFGTPAGEASSPRPGGPDGPGSAGGPCKDKTEGDACSGSCARGPDDGCQCVKLEGPERRLFPAGPELYCACDETACDATTECGGNCECTETTDPEGESMNVCMPSIEMPGECEDLEAKCSGLLPEDGSDPACTEECGDWMCSKTGADCIGQLAKRGMLEGFQPVAIMQLCGCSLNQGARRRRLQQSPSANATTANATAGGGAGAMAPDWVAVPPEQCHAQLSATEYCMNCATQGCLGGSLCKAGYTGAGCSTCVEGFFEQEDGSHDGYCGGRSDVMLIDQDEAVPCETSDACGAGSECQSGSCSLPSKYGKCSVCLPCPKNAWITLVLIGAAVWVVCWGVYVIGHREVQFASFGVLVTHCQLIAATFEDIEVKWPPEVTKVMADLGKVFNLKLQFIAHPECSAKISHLEKWSLFLAMPFVFATIYFLFFAWRWLCCWAPFGFVYRTWKRTWLQILSVILILVIADQLAFAISDADKYQEYWDGGQMSAGAAAAAGCLTVALLMAWRYRRPRWRTKEDHDRMWTGMIATKCHCIRSSVQMCFILYISQIRQAGKAMDCSDPPGKAGPRLDSNPSVECNFDDPVWPAQLAIGMTVFFLYGIVLPWKLMSGLKKARDEPGKYNDPHFQCLFGWPVEILQSTCRGLSAALHCTQPWPGSSFSRSAPRFVCVTGCFESIRGTNTTGRA